MIIFKTLRKYQFCSYSIHSFLAQESLENNSDSDIEVNDLPSEQLPVAQNSRELMSIISGHIDPKVLSEIYKMNKPLFEQQHYLLTFRITAHFLTAAKCYMGDHSFRETMNEISQHLNEKLNDLPSIDLLELLFFKSKFNMKGVGQLLEKVSDKQLEKAINDRLKDCPDFSLRHYINIWYDSQILNIEIPLARKFILQRLDSESLTSTEIILLLRCELVRQQKRKLVYQELIEHCLKHFHTNFQYYDFEQMTSYYLTLLKMRYQYFNPTVDSHLIFDSLRNALIDNLKKMDEHSLLSIVNGYELLSKDMKPNLELKIKEYILKQLNNKPHKISVNLLSSFIHNCDSLCSVSELDRLIEEIIDRLQLETHLHSVTQANKIGSQLLMLRNSKLSINSRIRLTIFSDYVQQTCKFSYPEQGILYLRYVCGLDVDSIITEENAMKHPYNSYAVISNEQLKSKLHSHLIGKIRENPVKAITEMLRNHQDEQPFQDLVQIAILEFYRKDIHSDRVQIQLFKLINDQKTASLFKECIQNKRQVIYRLAQRQYQMTQLQAQTLGNLLIQHIDRFNEATILNIVTNSNFIALITKQDPEKVSSIISILKQQHGGLAALAFCKYLRNYDVDYVKCLQVSQKNARLDAFYLNYDKMCVENKLIILYILYFN